MPELLTERLGRISYESESLIEFPRGLPGFEERRWFVAVEMPECEPLVFLQCVEDAGLCFITAPVAAIDPDYRLGAADEDLEFIGAAPDSARTGAGLLCLIVLSVRESGPSANLLAPVLVNLRARKAVQAISAGAGYSHRQPLECGEAVVCS